jgi:cytochrome P450
MTETPVMPVHRRRNQFDPDPALARLRARAPVTRIENPLLPLPESASAWLVTGYEEIRQVLGDSEGFSNAVPGMPPRLPAGNGTNPAPAAAPPAAPPLLGTDPPEHTRLRRMLTGEFTVKRMRRLQPRIEAIVAAHLDAMERSGPPADLVQSFALPVPSLVICELLGVPYADRAEFQRRSRLRLDMANPLGERMAAAAESQGYMAELCARQRSEPGEDLLGMLVREHGGELTDSELAGIGDLLLLAGHETTASMLGLGTALLLQNPGQLAVLRDQPGAVDAAVEELLRYLTIVHSGMPRTARTDVVIGSQLIRAGDRVICSLPAANRDGALGPDMDRLDLTREPTSHVAFGHGIHHCLGAPLARMEMRTAFPALLRRFPALRLAVPLEEVPFRAFSVVYGVQSLPVAW